MRVRLTVIGPVRESTCSHVFPLRLGTARLCRVTRLRRVAVVGGALVLALPAPASAVTTIGKTQSLNTACAASSFIELQASTAPGNPSFAVPAGGGVIVRWS